jgi:hypothetical protein
MRDIKCKTEIVRYWLTLRTLAKCDNRKAAQPEGLLEYINERLEEAQFDLLIAVEGEYD